MKRFALPLWLEIAGAILLALRAELVRELSSPGLRLSLDDVPLVREGLARDTTAEAAIGAGLRSEVARNLRAHTLTEAERAATQPPPPPPPEPRAPVFTGPGRPPPLEQAASLHVSIPAGAQWLNMRFGMRPPRPPRPPSGPVFYAGAVVIASLLLASLWMARRVARPLQRLAEAARRLRTGEAREAVPETGPQPVREAARAFNAMSERVTVTLQSQRALMAAVAHDLRTPIAALRVRAEFVTDDDTRTRLLQTIGEMQAMTEAVLDAVRIDGSGEPARSVDVAILAESLCADMAEVGGDVSYVSDIALACVCRAAEVRRALRNLTDNALRYGVRARVTAEAIDRMAAIHVDDDGPGIPKTELERVFEPFARLEHSRSAETGGYGLGLAIARLIARGHGGDVTLKNQSGGGLRATLMLPLALRL
jgi:signal transduction histidine kinase